MQKHLPKMFSVALILALVIPQSISFAAPAAISSPTDPIFINEIHYDNTGTDAGEAIEIFGPAGTDLTGWSIVLYNGSGGAVYDTDTLSGTIPDLCGGFGVVSLSYPSNGIQNGSPDGIALVNASSTLVQFLSYEGVFNGVGGAANGMTSTDIGVAEAGTEPLGQSLQLVGSGSLYGDFIWSGPSTASFGTVNTGQTCVGPEVAPFVSTKIPNAGATNVAVDANITVTFNEPVNVTSDWFDITCDGGMHTASVGGGPTTFTLDPNSDFANSEMCTVTVFAAQVTDQDENDPPNEMAVDFSWNFNTAPPVAPLVINEIDYDQPSTDTAEFVELRNNSGSGVDLSAYNLKFINGNGTAQYQLFSLPALSLAPGDYFVLCANTLTVRVCDLDVLPDTDLIQNGAPDAVALLFGTTVIDSVSYEGNTGAPYTEGSGVGLEDPGTVGSINLGISRLPDGSDTNQNNIDFSLRCITPGEANTSSNTACVTDLRPYVSNTNPASGAANVSISNNIDIVFSEAVTTSGTWYDVTCTISGSHTTSIGGGPTTFTLDPDADFVFGEACTVTITAANVVDQDGTPDNMPTDYTFSFTTAAQPFGVCGEPATFIHNIQGSGLTSPINGAGVTIEGVVVGDYQNASQFSGFHVQEEGADVDAYPTTSEGIFVFNSSFAVNIGDQVRFRGTVSEFSTSGVFLTELVNITDLAVCSSGNSVTATTVTLPVSNLNDWEAYEGMLINISQELTATENFTLGRFGEVALSIGGRLLNPTMVTTPGAPANALQNLNDRSRILLDDGDNQQNIDPTFYPTGGLSASNTLRSGFTLNGLTGVLEQRFGVYRVQPIGPISFNADNPRPAATDPVGGRLHVAAMNVLNYFTTLDTNPGSGNGPNICGPSASLECRGANTAFEFTRQRDKIISAILGLDADVVGLMEMENNATTAIQNLVDGLNAATAAGTYAFINTGTIGTDAIKVALIYRPASVTPFGAYAILDSTIDPAFIDTLNRPVLAQTFEENLTGELFTVAVNHLKSKGSDCNTVGDPDTGDGQGNCNITRKNAAIAEASWLAGDPTGSGDPDFILIGDFNAYLKEDPITALQGVGYTDLIDSFVSVDAYSYVFQGQSGYLDHGLATGTLTAQVTGTTEWHINADEPIALDYNTDFKSPNHVTMLYAPDQYRSSDHDPLVVGLDLVPQCNGQNATVYVDHNNKIVGGPFNGQTYQSVLTGTSGSDVIVGAEGSDTILALGGDDVICTLGGSDTVFGGAGNDTINSGDGSDTVFGGANNDLIETGAGNDTIFGESGNDTINGGDDKDNIFGGDGLDILDGGTGQDVIEGGLGVDTLAGGDNNDTVLGGPGNDSLDGGLGSDVCNGGLGTDTSASCETNILIP